MDDDFGVVKEEIVEEDCPLPCFNGRVVSWLVSAGISCSQSFNIIRLDRSCHGVFYLSVDFWEIVTIAIARRRLRAQ